MGGGRQREVGRWRCRASSPSETMAPFAPHLRARHPTQSVLRSLRGVRVMSAAAFAKGCPAAARHRCARLAGARGRLDERPRRFGGPAIQTALARIVARCGGRVTDFQAVEENQCWYGFAEGNDPAEKDGFAREDGVAKEPSVAAAEDGSREAHLVAGPPAPDSPSRQFSSAAHARMRGATAVSAREAAANAASAMVAPVSATDRLALPREVEGAPLTLHRRARAHHGASDVGHPRYGA